MPTQQELAAIIERTYPNIASSTTTPATIANNISQLYSETAVKRHETRDISYVGRSIIRYEYQQCMQAIPDMVATHGPLTFNSDGTVSVSFQVSGTHLGYFRDVPPSGEQVLITGTERFTFQGTTIVRHEVWTNYDTLGWNGIIVGAEPPSEPLFPSNESGGPGSGA